MSFRGWSLEYKFWSKVLRDDPDKCWLWRAGTCKGYGSLTHMNKHIYAHQASYIIHNGSIPEGLHVLHKCNNRRCVNPKHLYIGTNYDNILDKIAAGTNSGENNPAARFKRTDIEEMKRLRAKGMLQREIAAVFGTSQGTISLILAGKRW